MYFQNMKTLMIINSYFQIKKNNWITAKKNIKVMKMQWQKWIAFQRNNQWALMNMIIFNLIK